MSALLTALAFARHGHAVFPVNWPVAKLGKNYCSCGRDARGQPCRNPAKHPYGRLAPNGLVSATTESGIIKDWFGYKAPDANLGVCTDKLIVVDVDPRHGGDESWSAIERDNDVPLTWRALTGGGGEHVIFACPEGVHVQCVTAEQMDDPPLGRGVDIRACGGYIVAPPSKHISGRPYAWSVDHDPSDVRLAYAPPWLIERLTATPSAVAATGDAARAALPSGYWASLTMGPVTQYADQAAAQIVGHLFRHGCDYQLVLGLMMAWNDAACRPPLHPLEINRIVDRIAVREAERIEARL